MISGRSHSIRENFRFLWFLSLSYTMVLMLSNWFDARLVHFFIFNTDAGTIIFPLTFLLSDLITEVYGYKYARRAIWAAFLFNVVFILYGQIIIHLPSPGYYTQNAAFNRLFAMSSRIILASTISYLCSEPLNTYILAKLKIQTEGRYMGFRFVCSTSVASGVDSLIFGMIAFYGVIDGIYLLSLIITMWFLKVLIEVIGLPLSLFLAKKLKKIEEADMYDKHTNFNVFSLNTQYSTKDNNYTSGVNRDLPQKD